MDRRTAFTNLSGFAATSLLLALPAQQALAQTMSSATGAGASDYKMHTLMIGTLSKTGSQLALDRATHPQVKQFANFEIAEQTTVAQVLTDSMNPPPTALTQMGQTQLTRLKSASSGSFDADYVKFEIEGHQKLLQVQENFLSSSPTDMDRKHIAMLAKTVIQMHLTMLGNMQSMMG